MYSSLISLIKVQPTLPVQSQVGQAAFTRGQAHYSETLPVSPQRTLQKSSDGRTQLTLLPYLNTFPYESRRRFDDLTQYNVKGSADTKPDQSAGLKRRMLSQICDVCRCWLEKSDIVSLQCQFMVILQWSVVRMWIKSALKSFGDVIVAAMEQNYLI